MSFKFHKLCSFLILCLKNNEKFTLTMIDFDAYVIEKSRNLKLLQYPRLKMRRKEQGYLKNVSRKKNVSQIC